MISSTRKERRKPAITDATDLRARLNAAQLATLKTLEHFRWELRFVRLPAFRAPVPVLFDRHDERYVVIREDGSIDDSQTLNLRR